MMNERWDDEDCRLCGKRELTVEHAAPAEELGAVSERGDERLRQPAVVGDMYLSCADCCPVCLLPLEEPVRLPSRVGAAVPRERVG